jgi:hypothetical protein
MPGQNPVAGPTMLEKRRNHAMIHGEKGVVWAIGGVTPGTSDDQHLAYVVNK